ncbi:hypothetical protein HZC32_03195 [Candidatus Woesearchaeota archaeon]|nr:hypothetical protein [Candidatus Woesearchaeota archaeon]
MYPTVRGRFLEEDEEDHIHSRKTRERLINEDALNSEEDGFMEGFEGDVLEEEEILEAEEESYCKLDSFQSGK